MDGIAMHRLAARARGWLEAQPVGPERKDSTLAAYRRYAARGLGGMAAWDVPQPVARRLVEAGTRMVVLERLERAVQALDEALADGDPTEAGDAVAEVEECLGILRTVPPRRPGRRRARDGRDQAAGRAA